MLCPKCSNIIQSKSAFCGNCGSALEESLFVVDELQKTQKNKNRKNIMIITLFSIIALIVIGVFFYMTSYYRAIHKYMNAFINHNGEAMYDIYTDVMKDNMISTVYADTENPKKTMKEHTIMFLEEESESVMDNFNDELGDSYKVKYKIIEVESYSLSVVNSANESLKYQFGDNCKLYNTPMSVTVEITGRARKDTYSEKVYFTVNHDSLFWGVDPFS